MSNNRKTGKIGEDYAVNYLKENGYIILERNKHFSKNCEVDIIAKDNDTLVFVEVKTRRSDVCGSPFEAITKEKYKNIRYGLYSYISEHHYKNYRIDAIAVLLQNGVKIDHIKNI